MNPVEKFLKDCVQKAQAEGILGEKWDVNKIEQKGTSFVLQVSGPDDRGFDLQFKRRDDGAAACARTTNFSIVLLTETPEDGDERPILEEEEDRLLGDFIKVVETHDREPIPDKHWRKLAAATGVPE
jgi:hypothetical protein